MNFTYYITIFGRIYFLFTPFFQLKLIDICAPQLQTIILQQNVRLNTLFLFANRNGIGEGEMEDLLSLDDEVLNSSYRHWSPPNRNVVRVPPLLWTRLRYDLGGDLVERQAVGRTVLAFYHRYPTLVLRMVVSFLLGNMCDDLS